MEELFQRQVNGIKKAIDIILLFLNEKISEIKRLENVEIIEK